MDREGFTSLMGTLAGAWFEFFGADDPPSMSLAWHHVVFDPEEQIGAAEYTYRGNLTYHGITLVRLENDKIADWRENQYPSDLDWEAFSAGNRS